MRNPYKILNLSQNASIAEIARAQLGAMRVRKYSNTQISEAQSMLRKPASRLAADFTFPILERGNIETLSSSRKTIELDIDNLDVNKYDSLK